MPDHVGEPRVHALPLGPRFDVHLDGRNVRLRLVSPLDAPCLRLLSLESILDPIEGKIDLRSGARSFRHRRGVVASAEVEVDIVELAAEAEARALVGNVEARAVGRDVHLVPTRPSLSPARCFASLPSVRGIEANDEAVVVRDPLGWALREALVPHGFRAPRVTSGSLRLRSNGRRLLLALDADAVAD